MVEKFGLEDLVASCHYDPLRFVTLAYPWGEKGPLEKYPGPDTWQTEFLLEWGEEIRKRNFNGIDPVMPIQMTRSSGHGIGKGVMSAFICDFLMSTRKHCHGSVTANTYSQLETKTWAAIQKWTERCITKDWFEITGSIMWAKGYRPSWFTEALSCAEENAQAFAGQHAADSTSFYIVDEGSNVPDAIYNVMDGGLTDGEPMIFVFGNPTRSSGKFYRINFGDEREFWGHKAIDSRTCRYTNHELQKRWGRIWGEDSDRFRVQVKGLPPSASDVQFISTAIVSAAQKREAFSLRNDPLICGLDVSRGGADNCVFRFRRGLDARTFKPVVVSGKQARDSTVLVSKALDILKNGVIITDSGADIGLFNSNPTLKRVRVDMMFIDGTGVGGPICDQLKTLGYRDRVVEIQFGWEAPNTADYQSCANMRAWMWEQMRVWLQKGAIDPSTDLEADLTQPMYHYNAKNDLVLESKESMKKRCGTIENSGSPDHADALGLTFARPVAPLQKRGTEDEPEEEVVEGGGFDGSRVGKFTGWG